MKPILIAISMLTLLPALALANSRDCVKAALLDAEVLPVRNPPKDQYGPDRRFDFIFLLCGGATNRAPIRCYKKAASDSDLFPIDDAWKREVEIVQLCAGAKNLKPISCLKAATSEKTLIIPRFDKKWHQMMYAGLCRQAKDLSPIACFKKALADSALWEPAKDMLSFNDFSKYSDAATLCGAAPDFSTYGKP